ncbi:MAG: hypothetical protein V2A54_06175 [Bacteroidota bacterium]
MKRLLLTTAVFLISMVSVFSQGVAVNTSGAAPNTSAMLDVASTTKGLLLPNMTKAQRNAIVTPATSLLIYQTDNGPGFYYNAGTPAVPNWLPFGGPRIQEYSNLWCEGSTTSVSISAEYVSVTNATNTDSKMLFNPAVGINALAIGANGSNGLGAGMVWCYYWVMYNPTTSVTAGYLTTEWAFPVLAGYTYGFRAGVTKWDGTNISAFYQSNEEINYIDDLTRPKFTLAANAAWATTPPFGHECRASSFHQ